MGETFVGTTAAIVGRGPDMFRVRSRACSTLQSDRGDRPHVISRVRNQIQESSRLMQAMNSRELSRNCQLIIKLVAHWLSTQDELTRATHHAAVETVQIAEFGCIDTFVMEFEDQYPLLWNTYGRNYIEQKATAFFSSEFLELSVLFSGLFEEFNYRFFETCLPSYRVKVVHGLPDWKFYWDEQVVYEIDTSHRKELTIQYNSWPESMIAHLVNLMAHVHVGLACDETFRSELKKLRVAGAPTSDEVWRLKEVGWTPLSASAWSLS
jgi:hypothetical protein